MYLREDNEKLPEFGMKVSYPSPVDTREKVLVQVLLPVSVSHLVAYNYDLQKILTAYEAAYLRVNFHNILHVYRSNFSTPEQSRSFTKLANKALSIGYLVNAVASILVSFGVLVAAFKGASNMFKSIQGIGRNKNDTSQTNSKRSMLYESPTNSNTSVGILVYKVSDTLSVSTMALPTVDEFTTKEKIGMYSIVRNKSTLVYKGTRLYSDYDRIALLEHTKPIFLLTDVEYNRELFDVARENADFIIVDSTNDDVKMTITTENRVVTYTTKLSSVLGMRKYEEVDLNTLNSILQRLKT